MNADEDVFMYQRFVASKYMLNNGLNIDSIELTDIDVQLYVADDLSNSLKSENIKLTLVADNP